MPFISELFLSTSMYRFQSPYKCSSFSFLNFEYYFSFTVNNIQAKIVRMFPSFCFHYFVLNVITEEFAFYHYHPMNSIKTKTICA